MICDFGGKISVNMLPNMLTNNFFETWKLAVIQSILYFESLMAVREGLETNGSRQSDQPQSSQFISTPTIYYIRSDLKNELIFLLDSFLTYRW